MRIRCGTIHIVVLVALAVGAMAGWFAAGAWGGAAGRGLPALPGDASLGRACSMSAPDGRACRPATAADSKPRRKAPIRSSSESEVQKHILKADIAALEKSLAAAKKESERIVAAKSAIRASGEKLSKDLLLQREAALRKLKAEGKGETVGEMRRLAPDWFLDSCKLPIGKSDMLRRRTAEMLEILSAVDVSERTDEEKEIHARYMEKLADMSLNIDMRLDAVTDDTPCDEFWGIVGDVVNQTTRELWGAEKIHKREGKMLRDLMSRELGITEGEMTAMIEMTNKDVGSALLDFLPNVGQIGEKRRKGK